MNWVASSWQNLIKKLEAGSFYPWIYAKGCCRPEIENLSNATYDWWRLGAIDEATAPEQADLILIAGWLSEADVIEIRAIYEKLLAPKFVMAIGVCALSGAAYFAENEKKILAADIIPVDVYVPGCPPRPEAILAGLKLLQKKSQPNREQSQILRDALRDTTKNYQG